MPDMPDHAPTLEEIRAAVREVAKELADELRAELEADRAARETPYGDLPNQKLNPVWSEGIMRELFEHYRPTFGSALRAYATGDRETRGRPAAKASKDGAGA